jgi:signal recognition particle receptor subunit beta
MSFGGGQNEYKLLFTGPMGAGKTTAIRAISEIEPVRTEAANTTAGGGGKATTTVGLDYGEISLGNGERLRLYGTPGQDRFSALWEILTTGAMGVVILVDHSDPESYERMEHFLDSFAGLITETAGVIGLTHTEDAPDRPMDPYYESLAQRYMMLPVMPVDARSSEDIRGLLDALLSILESRLADSSVDSLSGDL